MLPAVLIGAVLSAAATLPLALHARRGLGATAPRCG